MQAATLWIIVVLTCLQRVCTCLALATVCESQPPIGALAFCAVDSCAKSTNAGTIKNVVDVRVAETQVRRLSAWSHSGHALLQKLPAHLLCAASTC
jgi:hypothetical protein